MGGISQPNARDTFQKRKLLALFLECRVAVTLSENVSYIFLNLCFVFFLHLLLHTPIFHQHIPLPFAPSLLSLSSFFNGLNLFLSRPNSGEAAEFAQVEVCISRLMLHMGVCMCMSISLHANFFILFDFFLAFSGY